MKTETFGRAVTRILFAAACCLALIATLISCDGGGNRDPGTPESTFAGNCDDGLDNDNDGSLDGADENCGDETGGNANCGDGIDNDGDGNTDCADGAADPDCPCGVEGIGAGNCGDGVDNDGDTVADGNDAGCDCADADDDGVCDTADDCADTPAGCTVDGNGCPSDSDADGVCDGLDECADTPGGCAVDAAGCPTLDADGDGVCDGVDACADTPAGCTADATGCPTDADGDTVCDGLDECADTPSTCAVGADGCPTGVCGNCTEQFGGGQPDASQCYRDASVQQGGCGGPFRLFLFVRVEDGQVNVLASTSDNPGGGGTQDPGIALQSCNSACGGDETTFECSVEDSSGTTRTITATLQGDNVVGTITDSCGTSTVAFNASPRADGDCPQP